jgi:hypothetical protein
MHNATPNKKYFSFIVNWASIVILTLGNKIFGRVGFGNLIDRRVIEVLEIEARKNSPIFLKIFIMNLK